MPPRRHDRTSRRPSRTRSSAESLRAAFVAAKEIYDELVPQKGVTGLATKVAKDEDVQDSLMRAVAELRNAADRIQEAGSRTATASATSS